MPVDPSGRSVTPPSSTMNDPQQSQQTSATQVSPTSNTVRALQFAALMKSFGDALRQASPEATPQQTMLPERVGRTDVGPSLPQGAPGKMPAMSASAGAPDQPRGPAAYPLPTPGVFSTGAEFRTRGAKNAALVGGAIQNIAQSVQRFKQQRYDQRLSESKALTLRYIAMKNAGGILGQEADKLLSDPKVQKVFDKAMQDPMSPEYFGIQQAYNDMMQQENAKLKMAELMSNIQQNRAAAQANQATADRNRAAIPREGKERNIAFGVEADANTIAQTETRLKEAQLQLQQKGWQFSGDAVPIAQRGAEVWTGLDLKDPKRVDQMPAEVYNGLTARMADYYAKTDFAMRKQIQAQQAALEKTTGSLEFRKRNQALKIIDPVSNASMKLNMMRDAVERAKAGDQQAMIILLSNHIGLTLGLQQGARITMTHWQEAERSAPFLQRLRNSLVTDSEGNIVDIRSGTFLTPEQMDQMIDAGQIAYTELYNRAQRDLEIAELPGDKIMATFPKPGATAQTQPKQEVPAVTINEDGSVTIGAPKK